MSATTTDTDDEEIIEIFVEEAGEVLENVDRYLAVLKDHPTDRNALGELRRGFHTLKGSGRMVKALDLGELAWKVENMLNRALEGKVPVAESMLSLLEASRAAMPRLLDALQGKREPGMEDELEALMARADAIASGQTPAAAAPPPAAVPAGDATQTRPNELERRQERATQRADEALHRSEMALQQVRGLVARIDAIAADTQDRPGRAELNPLVERVNAMTREVMELRQLAKKSQPEPTFHPAELHQLVDHRIKERLAVAERAKSEMEGQIDEALEAAAAARRVGLWALAVGLSVGGAAVGAVVLKLV